MIYNAHILNNHINYTPNKFHQVQNLRDVDQLTLKIHNRMVVNYPQPINELDYMKDLVIIIIMLSIVIFS
jgi:hypothetical protein